MRPTLLTLLAALLLAAPAAAGDKPAPAKPVTTTLAGTLAARSATAVTVRHGDRTLTCSLGKASPKLGDLRVGRHVTISCKNGVLVRIESATTSTTGTVAALTDDAITIQAGGGDVTCKVGDASPALGDIAAGDAVSVSCKDGVLTAVKPHDAAPPVTTITTGTLSALAPTSLTVTSDGGDRSCSRTADSPSLDGYAVGDRVRATCVGGVLTAIAHDDAPPPAPPRLDTRTGSITDLGDASLTVRNDGGSLTCTRGDGSPALGGFGVGDRVAVTCTNGVLTAIAKVPPPTVTVTTITTGTLSALTPTSLTVTSDGGDRPCSRTGDSPSLDGYAVGDHVRATCVDGVLTAIARVDAPPPPPHVVSLTGTIATLTDGSIVVRADADLTCARGDGSPALGDYRVGDRVTVTCTNGVLTAIAKTPAPTVTVTTITTGTLSALSPTSLTVTSDGGDRSCSRTAGSPSLDGYALGERVRATCVNGVLTAIARPT